MDDRQCLGAIPGINKITDTGDKTFKELQLTPWGVAKEQIDMLPEEIFNPQSMFVDICYKNEVYLHAIRERLMKSKYMNVPGLDNLENRLIYITRMQLYAICPLELTYKMCKAWFSSVKWPHAYIPDKHILKAYNMDGTRYRNPLNALDALRIFKNEAEENRSEFTEQSLYEFKAQELHEFMIDTVNKRENKMKFDVVVGNPPYNNDAYLDFVTNGHALASQYTCMITPAKWQAKGGEKNETFRRDIVPYMEKIVYHKDTKDIFDIGEAGGISTFCIGKSKKQLEVKLCCDKNSTFNNNQFEVHDEVTPVLLSHKLLNVIGKFGQLGEGFRQSLYVKNTDNGESSIFGQLRFKRFTYTSEQERGEKLRQSGMVEVMQGEKVVGYKKISDLFTRDNIDKFKCVQNCMVVQGSSSPFGTGKALGSNKIVVLKPYQVPKGSFQILSYFDTEDEAESFKSYINSMSMSLLQFAGVCGATMTKEFFRFIPDPADWTCTYVDAPHPNVIPDAKGYYELDGKRYCSLYVRYKLTDDDIKIIESIIKERK